MNRSSKSKALSGRDSNPRPPTSPVGALSPELLPAALELLRIVYHIHPPLQDPRSNILYFSAKGDPFCKGVGLRDDSAPILNQDCFRTARPPEMLCLLQCRGFGVSSEWDILQVTR